MPQQLCFCGVLWAHEIPHPQALSAAGVTFVESGLVVVKTLVKLKDQRRQRIGSSMWNALRHIMGSLSGLQIFLGRMQRLSAHGAGI